MAITDTITNLIPRKAATPLVEQLEAKAQGLRVKQADELDNAEALKQAAQQAAVGAATAARQATAVEMAQSILADAGVAL